MGAQILVNQYGNNWQRDPDVLALADGGFMVVWSSYFNEYDDGFAGTILSGRRFDGSGRPVTGEFVIDAIDNTAMGDPSIAPLAQGGYAIASSFSPTDDILGPTQAWVRPYNANGQPRGPDVRVDTPTAAEEQYEAVGPVVAGTGDGGFLAFYTASQSDSNFDDIYVRRFDALGRPVGPDRVVNASVDFLDQYGVETVTLTNGNVIAIWNSEDTLPGPNGSRDFEIRGSLFSATGQLIRSDFHLTRNVGVISPYPGLQGHFDVAPLAGGGFVISRFDYGYRSGTGDADPLFFQTYDALGRPTSRPFLVYATEEVQFDSEVVQLATGEIVVVWEQYSIADEVGTDLYARIMSADGRALTGVFEVGQDFSRYDNQEDASLVALAGGGFVVSYTHDNLDADDDGIAARVFGRGTAGNDALRVDASGYLAGLGGDDRLTGDVRANVLAGGAGVDVLLGGAGADRLRGGTGPDQLAGGFGADQFVFDARPFTPAQADRVADFGLGDAILIENAAFAGLGPAGPLSPAAFRLLGQGALDASDRILYNPNTGALFHDPDGSGPQAAMLFAVLANKPVLGADDVLVI